MKISGKTEDKKLVISGLFTYYETNGIPLDIILEYLRSKELVPDWNDLLLSAIKAGVNENSFIMQIENAISDSYGSNLAEIVSNKYRKYLKESSERINAKQK